MLIVPGFKKSLIVQQFQGNYLKEIRLNVIDEHFLLSFR